MKKQAVLFDMDGTLCDVRDIRWMVARGRQERNFGAFHRASVNCPPHEWVVEAARRAERNSFAVPIVTARSEECRGVTSWWLADHGVPSDGLWMRPAGDFRPDTAVKAGILRRLRQAYDIVGAYDDRPEIVDLWKSEGIPVTVVPGWEE